MKLNQAFLKSLFSFFIFAFVFSIGFSQSTNARQIINFSDLNQVTDHQIIYTFLKAPYFSKILNERQLNDFQYALGKCNLVAKTKTEENIVFYFMVKEKKKSKVASQLSLSGSILDAGNELLFVHFFREQMDKLGCLKMESLPAQMDRNAVGVQVFDSTQDEI